LTVVFVGSILASSAGTRTPMATSLTRRNHRDPPPPHEHVHDGEDREADPAVTVGTRVAIPVLLHLVGSVRERRFPSRGETGEETAAR
jgi:hypothetical protein